MLGPNRFYGRKVLGETLPGSTLRQVVGWHPVDARTRCSRDPWLWQQQWGATWEGSTEQVEGLVRELSSAGADYRTATLARAAAYCGCSRDQLSNFIVAFESEAAAATENGNQVEGQVRLHAWPAATGDYGAEKEELLSSGRCVETRREGGGQWVRDRQLGFGSSSSQRSDDNWGGSTTSTKFRKVPSRAGNTSGTPQAIQSEPQGSGQPVASKVERETLRVPTPIVRLDVATTPEPEPEPERDCCISDSAAEGLCDPAAAAIRASWSASPPKRTQPTFGYAATQDVSQLSVGGSAPIAGNGSRLKVRRYMMYGGRLKVRRYMMYGGTSRTST